MPLVNKAELADIIRCSLPTLGALIKRYPDMPVVERGRNGQPWQFETEAVTAFLEAKRAEAADEANARADLLDQFRLPIDDLVPAEERSLTPQQQLAAVRARVLIAKERRDAGHLVPVTDVRMVQGRAVANLAQSHDSFAVRFGRKRNFPQVTIDELAAELSEMRVAYVRDLGPFAPADASS